MKSVRITMATAVLTAAAATLAPPAQAMMTPGNYDVLTNRYTQASWVWFVSPCQPPAADCIHVSAIPRLKFYAYYDGDAQLVNGRYTLTVDVNDGLRCLPGYSMPTRDTYTWDEVTLAGTIDSTYDVDCGGLRAETAQIPGGAAKPPSSFSTCLATARVVRSSR
jgi:hypothetical protein